MLKKELIYSLCKEMELPKENIIQIVDYLESNGVLSNKITNLNYSIDSNSDLEKNRTNFVEIEVIREVPIEVVHKIETIKEVEVLREIAVPLVREVIVKVDSNQREPIVLVKEVIKEVELIKEIVVPVENYTELIKEIEIFREKKIGSTRSEDLKAHTDFINKKDSNKLIPKEGLFARIRKAFR